MNRVSSFFPRLNRKWLLLSLAVAAVVVSFLAVSLPDDRLHVSFLDVGQGDAILIQKGSQQVLVDGGPSPQAVCLGLGEKMPFWDRTIELVVLSHPSADHITGLVEVLKRYRVEQVLYPEMAFESGVYDEWLRLVREKGIKATPAQAGQQISLGSGVAIEVLGPPNPPLAATDSDVDNNAAVLRLSLGEVSFLLTADIMWQAEFELAYSRANLRSTVLKVAHHGSNTSSTPEFLAVAHPEIAVISVGAGNEYGHPTEEVLERLEDLVGEENIYRTDENGTVEFITDGERLWLVTGR
jgi:competence protein ComEC